MYLKKSTPKFALHRLDWRLFSLLAVLLVPLAVVDPSLFYSLTQLISVLMAVFIFAMAINTYPLTKCDYLMLIGCGYFGIGALDFIQWVFSQEISVSNIASPQTASPQIAAYCASVALILKAVMFVGLVDVIHNFTHSRNGLGLLALILVITLLTFTKLVAGDGTGFETHNYPQITLWILLGLLGLACGRIYVNRTRLRTPMIWLLIAAIAAMGWILVSEFIWYMARPTDSLAMVSVQLAELLSIWLVYRLVVNVNVTAATPFVPIDSIETLPDWISLVDSNGRLLQCNRITTESLNDQEYQQTIDLHHQYHDPEQSRDACEICQSLSKLQPLHQHQLKVKDKWLQISLVAAHHGDRKDVMLHICNDITASKEIELKYEVANRLYTVLRLTNKAIISNETKQELLDAVCNIAVNHGSFAMAWIGMIVDNQLEVVASKGDKNDYLANVKVSLDGSLYEQGPIGMAFNGTHVTFINDINTDPSFTRWRNAALECNFQSMAAIPVIHNEQSIGVFVLYAERIDAFDLQTLELLSSLSDDISAVVSYVEAEEKRIEAEAKLHQLSQAVEQSKAAITITDIDGDIQYVNSYYTHLTGYTAQQVLGQNIRQFNRNNETRDKLEQCFSAVLNGNNWHGEVQSLKHDGEMFWSRESVSPIVENGQLTNIVWITEDNSELHYAHETISQLAYFDPLTGLPNRRLYQDRFHQSLASAKRHRRKLALFYLDLDNFKIINDSWGHDFGDLLLKHVSTVLTQAVREMDTVSRLGGDEFTVIINDVMDNQHVVHVADNILLKLNQKIELAGRELVAATSIGISIFPDDGENAKELMKKADMAMYHAKERGRNTFQFFEEFLNIKAQRRLDMEGRIQKALNEDQFELYYQPQFDIEKGQLSGVEALIRWPDDQGGFIPNEEFIPIAEETALIIDIGKWVIYRACHDFYQLLCAGFPPVKLAVNISANQFKQSGLLKKNIVDALQKSQLSPDLLQLEITERVLIDDVQATVTMINELRAQKVTFAIDDFGTGYSSLSYLKTFAVDMIKIDRSFVNDIEQDVNDQAIIRAIISMAHELDLDVLAEGVENAAQLAFLRRYQCDYIQGFHYAQPMSASALLAKYGEQ